VETIVNHRGPKHRRWSKFMPEEFSLGNHFKNRKSTAIK
jgi:hypothetical protein